MPANTSNVEPSRPFLCDSPSITTGCDIPLNYISHSLRSAWDSVADTTQKWFLPFPNASIARLLQWTYSGSPLKSGTEVQRLVDEVISAPDFEKEHLAGISVQREGHRLDTHEEATGAFSSVAGWREGSVGASPLVAEHDRLAEGRGIASGHHTGLVQEYTRFFGIIQRTTLFEKRPHATDMAQVHNV